MSKKSKFSIDIFLIPVVFVMVICICALIFLQTCKNDDENLQLNSVEEKYVGTWELESITLISNQLGQSSQIWYPPEDANQNATSGGVFTNMCEKYYGKTKFFFDNKRYKNSEDISNNRDIKGSLTIDKKVYNFFWYAKEDTPYIFMGNSAHSVCKFDVIQGLNEIKEVYVSTASINTNNNLIINVSSTSYIPTIPNNTVLYIFKKI